VIENAAFASFEQFVPVDAHFVNQKQDNYEENGHADDELFL
jgi:hypothetical protein